MNTKTEEKFFRVLMFLSTIFIVGVLLLIVVSVLYKGLPSLSFTMLTSIPKGGFYFGEEGGILNAIIGSIYLSLGATFLAFIIGWPIALYMNVYLVKHHSLVNAIRFVFDVLWGVPSIVYGAFGFILMVFLGVRASLLAGIITVSLFIVPIMVRAIDESLKSVPRGLLESALSLGSTRSEISYRIFSREAFQGIITAILLSFGRAIGDAASVLFTTGYTDRIPTSLLEPSATLPLSIFFQLSSPIEAVQDRAYASATVLISMVLVISLLSRFIGNRRN
ncbi:MAG: phosphate ABC transporter, permease protein PstA [Bacteroidetes bacterium CG18_big_fil_WC_8_21_14_2_50_41_14]|nr:MAG: phosphate ABC transporter, permease protein PstA [Bacteroidetes bacterium CG18_big_fil_WC_8_21_14_2_50_41_14]